MFSSPHRRFASLLWMLVVAPLAAQSPRVDLHGDPLPEGAVVRLGTTRFRAHVASDVELSRNGKWIAAIGAPGLVLDAVTGKKLFETRPDGKNSQCLTFSADSKWLLAAGDSIEVWSMHDFKKKAAFPHKEKDVVVTALACSHDSNLLAVAKIRGEDGGVELLDRQTGKLVKRLDKVGAPGGAVTRLAFSGDGKRLFIGLSDDRMMIRVVATGAEVSLQRDRLLGLSPDGTLAMETPAIIDPSPQNLALLGIIRVRSALDDNAPAREFKVKGLSITSSALSEDNASMIVSGGLWNRQGEFEPRAYVFDLSSGKAKEPPESIARTGGVLRFTPDGKQFMGGGGGRGFGSILFWDRATGKAVRHFGGHDLGVLQAMFLSDGKTAVTLSEDGTVRLWDAGTGRESRRVDTGIGLAGTLMATMLVASPDGKRLAWAAPGSFHVWNLKEDKPPVAERFLVFEPRAAAFSPDNRWLTFATGAGTVQVFDADTRDFRRTLATTLGDTIVSTTNSLSYAPDGKTLACAAGTELLFFDMKTGKEKEKDRLQDDKMLFIAGTHAPDGRGFATIGQDAYLHVWSLEKKTSRILLHQPLPKENESPSEGVQTFAYSHDGALLATGHLQGKVRVWEAISLSKVAEFQTHDIEISSLDFAPDGRRLISASAVYTDAIIWDLETMLKASRPAPAEWKTLWLDLNRTDADKPQRAVYQLIQAGPGVVPFLADRLKEMFGQDTKGMQRIPELLEELDAPAFDRREKAQRELTEMGLRVLPIIRKQVTEQSSLEVRRRMERLIRSIEDKSEKQRWHLRRVVQVLEAINTAPAREQLQRLAEAGHEKEMAEGALARMAKRR